YCEGCDPDWYEPVLPKGKSEIGMSLDLKNEFSISLRVQKCAFWRLSERKSAENERSRAEDQVLFTVLFITVDHLDLSQSLPNKRCHCCSAGCGTMQQKGKKREK